MIVYRVIIICFVVLTALCVQVITIIFECYYNCWEISIKLLFNYVPAVFLRLATRRRSTWFIRELKKYHHHPHIISFTLNGRYNRNKLFLFTFTSWTRCGGVVPELFSSTSLHLHLRFSVFDKSSSLVLWRSNGDSSIGFCSGPRPWKWYRLSSGHLFRDTFLRWHRQQRSAAPRGTQS
jgi:hypothetical protein